MQNGYTEAHGQKSERNSAITKNIQNVLQQNELWIIAGMAQRTLFWSDDSIVLLYSFESSIWCYFLYWYGK